MAARLRGALAALAVALCGACTPPSAEPGAASPQPSPATAPSSARSSATPSADPARPEAGDHLLRIGLPGGSEGEYLLHAPAAVEEHRRLPLVIAFHGVPGSPQEMQRATGLDRLADRFGFLVAYPDSVVRPEDVGRLIDHLVARWRVDPHRVHVAGFSVGGALTYTLATALGGRVASFAAVAGPGQVDRTVDPPTSLVAFEGERDDLLPALRRADQDWSRRAGCRAPTQEPARIDGGPAVRSTATCRGGTAHVVYRVARMGHEWPADASRIIWAFFAAHPRR